MSDEYDEADYGPDPFEYTEADLDGELQDEDPPEVGPTSGGLAAQDAANHALNAHPRNAVLDAALRAATLAYQTDKIDSAAYTTATRAAFAAYDAALPDALRAAFAAAHEERTRPR